VSLRLEWHREISEDPSLQRRWNELALQMERPEVFYTWEWALAVQSAYHSFLKPLLLLGYSGDDLVGVASLATDPAGKTINFLAATTGDYCEFLSHPGRRTEFVDAVFAELTNMPADKLVLANLPADSATPAALRVAARKHGFHAFLRPAYACAQVELGRGEQRKQLKAAVLRKKMLHRKLRALERAGTVKYAHLGSWARIQPALQGFSDAHVARFLATHRISSLATAERRHFLEDLARRFGDSGVVTLSLLLVNDQPVAWNYGFQFCGSWFWYQPTFDSRWGQQSPGYCLLSRIVTEACDMDEMKVVDLGLGGESYKERFGNTTRQTLHVTVTKSVGRHLQEILRYRAASVLKQSPKIESAVRSVLGRLQTARRHTDNEKHLD
jgi:CelD/BcsL family acetyltransferase involved in cellulose biosynthesis